MHTGNGGGTHRVWEDVGRGHRGEERALGEVAVAHLAPPWRTDAPHLADGEGREAVLQVEALRLVTFQVLVPKASERLGWRVAPTRAS